MAGESMRCTVCGYVHVGGELPACCPVCGVGQELFEAEEVSSVAVPGSPARAWRCLVCDYLHEGAAPPEACPVCGAGPDQFEAVYGQGSEPETADSGATIVIVGAGIAGISAAAAARETNPAARILVVGREPELPYYRINLTRYLAGELTSEQLSLHPAGWYEERRIELRPSVEVTAINAAARSIRLGTGETVSYDRLILTLGAHSFVPPVAGIDKAGVMTLRTYRDACALLEKAGRGAGCVVIGGGVLGLETAAALAGRGARVTVIESFDWLLPRQLNPAAGKRLATYVEKLGIRLLCGVRLQKLAGENKVSGVVLETGETLPADLVIFAAGVRCNSALARQANLEVHDGILVDNRMQTSIDDVFAAGDVAEHQGVLYGAWLPAQQQGKVAGVNAAGGSSRFPGLPRSNILKVLDVDLFSIGNVHPADGSYQVFEDSADEHYALFVFRNSTLAGAVLLGDTSLSARLKELIENRTSCSAILHGVRNGAELRRRLLSAGRS
ncbi:MAG: FAD-dependent oxidoreductase [Syntrophotalea acetylenica]|nr:FAD-dependent oxidoreductase [Syntrophotalea acetylenica]